MRNEKGQFVKGHKSYMNKEIAKKVSKTCKEQDVGKWMLGRKLSEEIKAKVKKNNARHWLGKKRENVSRENHHSWKANKTSSEVKRLIRHSFEYRQWRSDIFKRDNFTCVLCFRQKEVSGKLEADHYPKFFADILVEYNIQDIDTAVNCEELWNINNGRTLCKDCHEKTSNYFFKAIKRAP